MTHKFKLTAIVAVFMISYGLVHNLPVCLIDEDTKADRCAASLFLFGDRNASSFENLEDYCSSSSASEKCMKDYAKNCLSTFAKQITNLLVLGISKFNKKLCKNGGDFADHLECVLKNITEQHACMDKYIDNLQAVLTAEKKTKISTFCCSFHVFQNCIETSLTSVDCASKSVTFFKKMVNSMFPSLIDLFCNDIETDAKKCSSIPTKESFINRTLSIFPQILVIFTSF